MKTSQLSKFKQEVLKVLVLHAHTSEHLFSEHVCQHLQDGGILMDNGKQLGITRDALEELRADGFVVDTESHSTWPSWAPLAMASGFLELPTGDGLLTVRDVRDINTDDGYTAMAGTTQILGVLYHVRFMLVSIQNQFGANVQAFHLAAELGEVSAAGDPYHTFELPGYSGEWIMTMFPECA